MGEKFPDTFGGKIPKSSLKRLSPWAKRVGKKFPPTIFLATISKIVAKRLSLGLNLRSFSGYF